MAIFRVQNGHSGAIFQAISPSLERDFGAIFWPISALFLLYPREMALLAHSQASELGRF